MPGCHTVLLSKLLLQFNYNLFQCLLGVPGATERVLPAEAWYLGPVDLVL